MNFVCTRCGRKEAVTTRAAHCTCGGLWKLEADLPAFVLLSAIGAGMIKESLSKEESNGNDSFSFKTMLLLALATSIDALAVGITFALLPDVNVPLAVCLIGITTFVCSAAGLKVGNLFGLKYKAKAELAGGIILILIGLKILLEHLGVISF